jgi:hypothetical protein
VADPTPTPADLAAAEQLLRSPQDFESADAPHRPDLLTFAAAARTVLAEYDRRAQALAEAQADVLALDAQRDDAVQRMFQTPSASKPIRPAYGDPGTQVECDADAGVGWDLADDCRLTIGHDLGDDGETVEWTVIVTSEQGHVVRTVTPAQVEDYARQLLALVARHRAQPSTPSPVLRPGDYVEIHEGQSRRFGRVKTLGNAGGRLVVVPRAASPVAPAGETPAPPGPSTADVLRAVARGRREYAAGCQGHPFAAELAAEAVTWEAAARIADGELRALYGLLPSWRWTDGMTQAAREGRSDSITLADVAELASHHSTEYVRQTEVDGWNRRRAALAAAGSVAANSDTSPPDVREVSDDDNEQPSTPPDDLIELDADAPEGHSVYVYLQPKGTAIAATQDVGNRLADIAVDRDSDGYPIAVEILGALAVEVDGYSAQPSTPPAEVRPDPARRLVTDILAVINRHQGERAMAEIEAACMASMDRAARPPAEVRTEPAKALLADILAVVNRHQGRNAEQAMEEIHEACMASIDRAAIPPEATDA